MHNTCQATTIAKSLRMGFPIFLFNHVLMFAEKFYGQISNANLFIITDYAVQNQY